MKPQMLVVQLGARMHYAVPRILNEAGLLKCLVTDLIGNRGWPSLCRYLPTSLRRQEVERLLGRIPQGIPSERIITSSLRGLVSYWQRATATNQQEWVRAVIRSQQDLSRKAIRHGLGSADAIYAFNGGGLEVFQAAGSKCLKVLEQTIAPRHVETILLGEERHLWPDWEHSWSRPESDQLFADREAAEWGLADRVLCPSEFVLEHVAALTGSSHKCALVPYGVDLPSGGARPPRSAGGKLRVLFAGAVGLRKGAPYVLELAKRLPKSDFEFRAVGPVKASGSLNSELRRHIDVAGIVSRSSMLQHFHWADVLLLPSICEGSPTVTYEALAAGVPVISTKNAGTVVRDGIDGFIVPIRDVPTMEARLVALRNEPETLLNLSRNARNRSRDYTVEQYGRRLTEVLISAWQDRSAMTKVAPCLSRH